MNDGHKPIEKMLSPLKDWKQFEPPPTITVAVHRCQQNVVIFRNVYIGIGIVVILFGSTVQLLLSTLICGLLFYQQLFSIEGPLNQAPMGLLFNLWAIFGIYLVLMSYFQVMERALFILYVSLTFISFHGMYRPLPPVPGSTTTTTTIHSLADTHIQV